MLNFSRLNHWRATHWIWVMALSISGVWSAYPDIAVAGTGELFDLQSQDLHLLVDSRWAGTVVGGYYPIRIQVENFGEDCQLTIRFTPYQNQELPIVERNNLQMASGSKALITLSVPMVGRGAIGNLEVEKNGVVVEQLKRQLSLAHWDHRSERYSLLVITNDPISTGAAESGVHLRHGIESRMNLDMQILQQPRLLPSLWIDYTGLDIVMVPIRVLAELDSDKRSAILQWAQTGGILVVYEVGEPGNASTELQSLLNLPDSNGWMPARIQERLSLEAKPIQQMEAGPEEDSNRGPGMGNHAWPLTEEAFSHHDFLLGRVYAFPGNPFPGTPNDWEWWSSTIPADLSMWEARMGVLPRRANENFFNFLIPGVTSVPIYAFLVLMTLFTIVIGPLNYFILRRRKQTYLLLLTIPAIAFLTSVTLFIYSTLAYGFSVASRSRSLTILDQRTNTAVSLARISLFAGIAPSEGLTFSPSTAVFPMWAPLQFGQSRFESGRLTWGDQQKLADGWLRSRTRTQFTTIQNRTERGRLEIASTSPSRMTISNGTEWDIAAIFWVDENENAYVGGALAAGGTGELQRVTDAHFQEQLQPFHAALTQNEGLEVPDDIEEGKQSALGLMEMKIQQFLEIKIQANTLETWPFAESKKIIPARSYLAVLADRPGIELGLEDTDERAGYHLLLGQY